MPISFPTNPSSGDTYDYGGIHYIFNNDGWVNKSIYGISAGTNISFSNYNGTGPIVISSTASGSASGVISFNGKTGAVQGVSSFAGLTGTVGSGITTNGILYFDGSDVQGSALLTFNGSDIVLDTSGHFDGNILGRSEVYIKADEAINEGDPVYVTGSVGSSERLTVAKADSAISAKMPAAGIAAQSLALNGEGVMIINGWVRNYNTTGLTANQTLFVASGGGLTATRPTSAGVLVQNIARVGRPNSANGSIIVTGASRTNDVPNALRVYQYIEMPDGFTFNTVVSSFNGSTGPVTFNNYVSSFNGNTGAIQGVSSINGSTGAITNVAFTNVAQTFSALQSFSSGISASSGITFENDISVNGLRVGRGGAGDINSVAIGSDVLPAGTFNVAIGKSALQSAVSPTNNVAIGWQSGMSGDSPINNVSIGANSLRFNVFGQGNVAIGYEALYSTKNNANTAIGSMALRSTSTGIRNTAIGNESLYSNTSGVANVAIGHQAGRYRGEFTAFDFPNDLDNEEVSALSRTTGTGGIYIGQWSRASANGTEKEIVIGTEALGLGSNTAVIGATSQVSATIYGTLNLPGGLSASGATFSGNISANNIVNAVNGKTGGVTLSAGTGVSVAESSGTITFTNTGVLSFNGNTGAIQGVSSINGSTGAVSDVAFTNVNNNFSVTQNFAQGLTAANTVELYADTSYFYPAAKGNRFLTVSPGPQNFISGNGNSSVVLNQSNGNAVYIGDVDVTNNGTYIKVEDNTSTISFNYGAVGYYFPTSAGSSGQVLSTNGVNSLSWANNVSTFNGSTGDISYSAISRFISSISTDTNAGSTSSTDYVYVCTAGLTLTMPTAVSNTNRYSVKNTSSSLVRIFTTSSQTIDGITFLNLTRQYQAVDLMSDGSNWSIF